MFNRFKRILIMEKFKYKVKEIFNTCSACPAQWEGTLEDGRMIYVRYRRGAFTVDISDRKTTDIFDAVNGERIIAMQIGGEFDGYMEDVEMKKILTKYGFKL